MASPAGLDFQLVDVKFTQGIDTETNKKLVVPGKWNKLENATLSFDGTVSKRPGIQNLQNLGFATTTPTTGNGLAVFNDQLLKVRNSQLSSTDFTGANQSALFPEQFGYVGIEKKPVFKSASSQESPDCASGVGAGGDHAEAFVWRNISVAGAPTGISFSLMDSETGALKMPVQLLHGPSGGAPSDLISPRVVFMAGAFFVFYIDQTNLYGRVVFQVGNTWTMGNETALITSGSLGIKNFDACEFVGDLLGSVGVSYAWNDGTTSVRAIRVTRVGIVPTISAGPTNLISQAQLPYANLNGIGVCPMYIAGQNTYYATFTIGMGATACSGTATRICDANLSPIAAAAQIDATVNTTNAPAHVVAMGHPTLPKAMVFTDQVSTYNLDAPSVSGVLPLRRTIISTQGTAITIIASDTLINSAVGRVAGGSTHLYPQGPFICGKPFGGAWDNDSALSKYGPVKDRIFLPVCIMENYAAPLNTVNQQNSWFLMDGVTGKVVGKALYGAYGMPTHFSAPTAPFVSTPSSTPMVSFTDQETNVLKTYNIIGVMEQSSTLSINNDVDITPCGISSLQMTSGAAEEDFFGAEFLLPAPDTSQMGPVQYFSGGSLSQFDTQAITEMGFPLFPEGAVATNAGGGGAMTAGVHQIVAIFEWYDGAGQRHQSAPSLPVSVTTALNDKVDVIIPTMLLSQKTGITLVLYMTLSNQLDFYRVTPINDPVPNVTTAAFVLKTITSSDASIAGNELLYHQPGQPATELRNLSPGPNSVLAVHQNRLFIDQTDKIGVFRYSQPLNQRDGLQWNTALTGTIPSDGGRITGIVSMDDKLIIFSERKVYWVSGSGPSLNGLNNNFGEPQEIPSDTGCVYPRSVLLTPVGIFFKSLKGWYKLSRGLEVKYVGAPVKAFDYQNVTAAAYLGDKQEARFHTDTIQNNDQGVPQCVQLIYSYEVDQWSTTQVEDYIDVDGNFVPSKMPVLDAVWWPAQKSYFYISEIGFQYDVPNSGVDIPRDATSNLFSLSLFSMTARTAFLHLPALEGFQRVNWLYLTASADGVPKGTLGITVDFDDVYQAVTPPGAPGSYTTQFNLQGAGVSFSPSFDVDLRHKLQRQKCKSVAFTFYDISPPDDVSHIVGFQAMLLQIGMKRGTNKLPATKSVP